ncbi:MAG: metallophosphoesterase [Patescibacteria group bacterium]|nr:metallophosphoesterase [Patescibacteria group bacterium]
MPNSTFSAPKYYFISDTHVGGDGILNNFEAEKEFIKFLNHIFQSSKNKTPDDQSAGQVHQTPKNNPKAHLYILGDFFGMWEYKKKKAAQKLLHIQKTHPKIFKTLKKISKKIKIILIPGNHDHDLACYPEFIPMLKKWGINLIPKANLVQKTFKKTLHLEHGHRFDPYNNFQQFGNIHDTPYAFHLFSSIILKITKAAQKNRKKRKWLANIALLHPIEIMPYWFLSNYFYRELGPMLRLLIAPVLIFFTFSLALLSIAIAARLNLVNIPDIFYFTRYLGPIKYLANTVIITNFILLLFFLVISITFKIIKKDIKTNLEQYGFKVKNKIRIASLRAYRKKITAFLKQNPQIQIFISAHTHIPSLRKIKINGQTKIIADPGTWTKGFLPIKSWFRLPRVFFPFFRLSYLVLEKQNKNTVLSLNFWPKKTKFSLTWLERFSIIFKKRNIKTKPKKIILTKP